MKVDIAVYTATEGFDWQPGSAYSKAQLEKYHVMIGRFPDILMDVVPYGGVFVCDGRVVFYRYLVFERGDSRGRDALYCVLGTLSFDQMRKVDLAQIFASRQFSRPRKPFPTDVEVEERPVQLAEPQTEKDLEQGLGSLRSAGDIGYYATFFPDGKFFCRMNGSRDRPQLDLEYSGSCLRRTAQPPLGVETSSTTVSERPPMERPAVGVHTTTASSWSPQSLAIAVLSVLLALALVALACVLVMMRESSVRQADIETDAVDPVKTIADVRDRPAPVDPPKAQNLTTCTDSPFNAKEVISKPDDREENRGADADGRPSGPPLPKDRDVATVSNVAAQTGLPPGEMEKSSAPEVRKTPETPPEALPAVPPVQPTKAKDVAETEQKTVFGDLLKSTTVNVDEVLPPPYKDIDVICPVCKGAGEVPQKRTASKKVKTWRNCSHCLGKGSEPCTNCQNVATNNVAHNGAVREAFCKVCKGGRVLKLCRACKGRCGDAIFKEEQYDETYYELCAQCDGSGRAKKRLLRCPVCQGTRKVRACTQCIKKRCHHETRNGRLVLCDVTGNQVSPNACQYCKGEQTVDSCQHCQNACYVEDTNKVDDPNERSGGK